MNPRVIARELKYWVLRRLRALVFLPNALRRGKDLERLASLSSSVAYGTLEAIFAFRLPRQLRSIRRYFRRSQKGFGEDALFGMWWLILESLKPRRVLEIGVYRGQVLAFWTRWSQISRHSIECWGISPFDSEGDEVSRYVDLDYWDDIVGSFAELEVPLFRPITALSTSPEVKRFAKNEESTFDLVYVDGGHDLSVVRSDVKLAHQLLHVGGLLVLDDAADLVTGALPKYAFRGHAGPSQVALELCDSRDWALVGQFGHNVVFRRGSPNEPED